MPGLRPQQPRKPNEVQRAPHQLLPRLGHEHLEHGNVADDRLAVLDRPDDPLVEQIGDRNLHVQLGKRMTHDRVFRERTTVAARLLHVLNDVVEKRAVEIGAEYEQALLPQRVHRHVEAAVLLPDHSAFGHLHLVVVNEIGARIVDRLDRTHRDARCLQVHQEHREPAVLGLRCRVGTGEQPVIRRPVGHGVENLFAADDVVIVLFDRPHLDVGDIASRVRLGVAERDLDLARRHAGNHLHLQLFRPVREQDAGHVQRLAADDLGVAAGQFLHHHQLVAERPPAPAVFRRPVQPDPALRAQPAVEFEHFRRPGHRHPQVSDLARELLAQLVGQLAVQPLADFPPELGARVYEIHLASACFSLSCPVPV